MKWQPHFINFCIRTVLCRSVILQPYLLFCHHVLTKLSLTFFQWIISWATSWKIISGKMIRTEGSWIVYLSWTTWTSLIGFICIENKWSLFSGSLSKIESKWLCCFGLIKQVIFFKSIMVWGPMLHFTGSVWKTEKMKCYFQYALKYVYISDNFIPPSVHASSALHKYLIWLKISELLNQW